MRKIFWMLLIVSALIFTSACSATDYDSSYDEDYDDYEGNYESDYEEDESLIDTEEDMSSESNEINKPKGLILLTGEDVEHGKDWVISCIDPVTGDYQEIARINMHKSQEGEYVINSSGNGFIGDKLISNDFSKLKISRCCSHNNESHAGWIDINGDFYDVTTILGFQSENDFAERVNCHSIGFMDEYFVFSCEKDDGSEYYSVPINDVSTDAMIKGLPPGVNEVHVRGVTDWIDENTYITNYRDSHNGHETSFIGKVDSEEQNFYIPENNRTNWNGFISPDGTQIAFMSSLGEGETGIYVVSVDGGEPVEVPIDADISLAHKSESEFFLMYQKSLLIDWR